MDDKQRIYELSRHVDTLEGVLGLSARDSRYAKKDEMTFLVFIKIKLRFSFLALLFGFSRDSRMSSYLKFLTRLKGLE